MLIEKSPVRVPFESLPAMIQEIITVDREIGVMMLPKIVPIALGHEIREKVARRRELAAHASKTWGRSSSGKGGPGLA